MWIKRTIEEKIKQSFRTRPIIVLTGARQTGKTSLLRHIFPNYNFVSLDLPSEAEQAEKAPEQFLSRHKLPLIIDEVQYAPEIFRYLKIAVDRNRNQSAQFLLTGSQKFKLMENISESLAGRVELFELESLGLEEIRAINRDLPTEDIIVLGGYPEIYAKEGIDRTSFYRSYIATYIERDVRSIVNVTSLRDFERFIRACALRSSQILNKAEIARDVGISPSTANEWLSVLVASGLLHLVEPWFSNKTRSIVKSPKMYFADTGLLTTLLNINTTTDLLNSIYVGAIWETFVYSELRKRSERQQIFFWNNRRKEVDFVIDKGGILDVFEAKWTEKPDSTDIQGFVELKKHCKKVNKSYLVCRTKNNYPFSSEIEAVNIETWKE